MKRVLKKGMSINCRTEDEEQVFREFASNEGHMWSGGSSLLIDKSCHAPCSFQIEYDKYIKYPNSITYANVGFNDNVTQVEASELFRNQLISRRIKNGIS